MNDYTLHLAKTAIGSFPPAFSASDHSANTEVLTTTTTNDTLHATADLGHYQVGRTVSQITTGQSVYAEFLITTAGGFKAGFGFADSGENLNQALGTSFFPESFGFTVLAGGLGTEFQSSTTSYPCTCSISTPVIFALAFASATPKIWFKNVTQALGWNDLLVGTQNPATGDGGVTNIDTSFGSYAGWTYMAGQAFSTFDSVQIIAPTQAIPSGFTVMAP